MGTYLNPGKQGFQMAVNSEIFVDKSEMIQYLNTVVNTHQRFVSVSRPRRFGKTIAADMICAYYDREADSREVFAKQKIADCKCVRFHEKEIAWDEYLGKFDVIRIVMTRFFKKKVSVTSALAKMQKVVVRDIKKEYPGETGDGSLSPLLLLHPFVKERKRTAPCLSCFKNALWHCQC